VQNVYVIASAATSTYLSVLDDKGDMQVAIADMSIIDRLSADSLKPQQEMLKQSALIVLDSNLPDDTLAWLTHSFAATPIFADTVSTIKALRLKPYLPSIHTLKTGTIEVEALTGLEARTQTQLLKVADRLHGDGVERVFITRGDQGVFYSSNDGRGMQEMKRNKREVHNAGGAGDAFLAGLAYAWLENYSLEESVRFALAAADITLSHPATSSPALSLAAVNQVMELQRAG
jgi:pseudouridine kinase